MVSVAHVKNAIYPHASHCSITGGGKRHFNDLMRCLCAPISGIATFDTMRTLKGAWSIDAVLGNHACIYYT